MDHQHRIVDQELDELLGGLPAVSSEGPRAVGKTATAARRAATIHRLDDPGQLEILAADPDRVVTGEPPVLIDECRRLPSSWDLVRRAVDRDPVSRGGEHEVDLIVERRDGRVVALELKLTATVQDHDVRHLRWLAQAIGDDLLDAAVITTGREAYRRPDGIAVIPAALLTA